MSSEGDKQPEEGTDLSPPASTVSSLPLTSSDHVSETTSSAYCTEVGIPKKFKIPKSWRSEIMSCLAKQVIRVKKLVGLPPPALELLGRVFFLGSEEPSLKLSRSSELQRTNSSGISNCWRSKSAIFVSRNINF